MCYSVWNRLKRKECHIKIGVERMVNIWATKNWTLVAEPGAMEMVGKSFLIEFPSNYEATRALVSVLR